ncbi:M24 family metallopeptidase [Methanolobus halotolerans]|uniref:Aminopeptidase P family protein n=1 Tax=Methanolobus halotolerans TaxID=2052935 RepID=A0A4E0Q8Q7_9EURY|nr:Xaa-Pro peptidase family protein [Methanolobus halotolerans]TGC11166.1 aminopeptidase P family protein [Methanolobus halotolerans]
MITDKNSLDISETLQEHRSDAFMIVGNSNNADMFYSTHFFASDSFAYIQTKEANEIMLVSEMERGRAEIESRVAQVRTLQDCNYRDKIRERGDPSIAYCDCLAEILQKHGVRRVSVPRDFPYHIAQTLKEEGFSFEAIKSPFQKLRARKSSSEVGKVRKVQDACNLAMKAAVNMIHKSEEVDGKLNYQGYDLTSEKVRHQIDITLLDHGCESEGTIVSCGKDSANPHWEGAGVLRPDEPIVIDIFPRNKKSRYYADMTRTVIKGEASQRLEDMYEAVLVAQQVATGMIKPGLKCNEIHSKVCDIFDERGYGTSRSGSDTGFIHSTGHGVGLEIHEAPFVGERESVLEAGNIITIEPGLYYPDVGGIRLEDLILVTDDGFENLTEMEKRFIV